MRLFFILFSVFIIVSGCGVDRDYVRQSEWVWDSGFRIGQGDFMKFDKQENIYQLNGDTIYYRGKPKAVLIALSKKFFNLTIRSVETGEIGYYNDIAESVQ